jgi:hypothetical protein
LSPGRFPGDGKGNMEYQELLDSLGYDDWDIDPDGAVLTSPNGHRIEPDGVSPDGEVSPLREMGMI